MKKMRLSLPNLSKVFNIVKFRRAYILERSFFQTTKEDLFIFTKKSAILTIIILIRRVLGERVYNLI